MTTNEILEKVAATYTLQTRSLKLNSDTSCLYVGLEGRRCGVALFCKQDDVTLGRLTEMDRDCSPGVSDFDFSKWKLDDLLEEEAKGHELEFWSDVQYFHDEKRNWNEDGLTERGKEFLQEMKTKWA